VTSTINDSICLDFDFIAHQYDLGYVSHINRSSKKLQEIKWNSKALFQPKSLREFHSLVYNSPIQYAPFLKKRKFQKFDFTLEEIKNINGEEVYVISFSSPRNHSTYTRRVYLSNYTGYLYVNKNSFAITKIFENWEVTEFPNSFKKGYDFSGKLEHYSTKNYKNESTLTEFTKINGLYYLSHATNIIDGEISDLQNNSLPFELKTDSYWSEFNIKSPIKISNSQEQHLFEMVKHNSQFWEQFKNPKK
jgi:hypothetical protein